MPGELYDLNPVTHITADAVGEPGQRTFYIQARQGSRLVTLVCEKQQVAALALGIEQLYRAALGTDRAKGCFPRGALR